VFPSANPADAHPVGPSPLPGTQRHLRLPEFEDEKARKRKAYPIGFFHIDIGEVQTADGELYLFVAIDRTSRFAFTPLVERATRVTASAVYVALIAGIPYKIYAVLTDNGIRFRFAPRYTDVPIAGYITHTFDLRCREYGIEHRFTKSNHCWINGHVERMNHTIKEAIILRYHYDDH
jgi:transposase InsO family protein